MFLEEEGRRKMTPEPVLENASTALERFEPTPW
jgi:hypothetical protein